MSKNWSPYQERIFAFVTNESGNAIVEAVAGSGKSTTIVECCNRLPKTSSHIMLAFNKSIAEELKAKGVNGRTFHSLCYTPVTKSVGTPNVEPNKLRMLCDKHFTSNDSFMYSTFCCKLVGLARQAGIGCLVPDTEDLWWNIVEYHDLEVETENSSMARGVELARSLLNHSNESKLVDFDDLLYLAVKNGVSLPKFDFVFVDEAQDTNAIQRVLIKKIMNPNSRLIAVGDPAQAIYGFRGADSTSLGLIAEDFNCKTLPLTVSYRCATSIVNHAHTWVDHIEAAPDAQQGKVVAIEDWSDLGGTFKQTDLVICRTTKPLVTLAYRLMKARVPVKIMGREIGQGLISLINKQKCNDVDSLILKIESWREREVEKAMVKSNDYKVNAVQDKADCIICLVDSLGEDDRTINKLTDLINNLFSNSTGCLTLATIHKAKGMESDTVFWLNSSQCPAKWAKQDWQQQQENNLCYVATTRAISTLCLIEEPKAKKMTVQEAKES